MDVMWMLYHSFGCELIYRYLFLQFCTAARGCDVLSLKYSDLADERGRQTLSFTQQKVQTNRVCNLSKLVYDTIMDWKKVDDPPSAKIIKASSATIGDKIIQLRTRFKSLQTFNFSGHDVRKLRINATATASEKQVKAASSLAGHSNTTTTVAYYIENTGDDLAMLAIKTMLERNKPTEKERSEAKVDLHVPH